MMKAAFCISGGGTTVRRILDECRYGTLYQLVEPVLVIASRDCGGIQRCIEGRMPPEKVLVINRKDYDSPEDHARAMLRELRARGVDFVGLYGYTTLMHPIVIDAFPGMMVNQHPGPLDPPNEDFGGQGMVGECVHRCVLAFAKAVDWQFSSTEATAHRVTPEYDKGMVVGRQTLELRTDHTPDSLAGELLPIEHLLQVEVIGRFASGKVEELSRSQPLIRLEWVPILKEIKAQALASH